MIFYWFKVIFSNIHLYQFYHYNASEEDPEAKALNVDDTHAEELLPLDVRCYVKAALIIDNVNKVFQHIFLCPRFSVSIDYMTKRFKIISKPFWAKNNHVKEGYSSWWMCFTRKCLCYKILLYKRVGYPNE